MNSPPALRGPPLQVSGFLSQSPKPADEGAPPPPSQAPMTSTDTAATATRPTSLFDLVRMFPPVSCSQTAFRPGSGHGPRAYRGCVVPKENDGCAGMQRGTGDS